MATDGRPGWISRLGLRGRVIALTLTLTVVLTAVLVVSGAIAGSRIIGEEIDQRAQALAAFLAASATDPLANLDMKVLRALLAEVRSRSDVVDAYVFDEELRLLTDGTLTNRRRHLSVADGVRAYLDPGGAADPMVVGDRVWIARPIRLGDRLLGGVALELSLERLHRARQRYVTSSLLLALAVLAVGAVVGSLMAGAVTRPIDRLTEATRAVTRGDFDREVAAESSGEVEALAQSFNRMVRRLSETTVSRDSIDAVLRSMEEGILLLDHDAVVNAANPAARALLGATTEEELRGLDALDLVGGDREEAERRFEAAFAGEDPAVVESVLRRIDGAPVPVELSIARVPATDGPPRLVCVARDIRERLAAQRLLAASEERYRRLVELAPEGIAVVRDGRVVFVNPSGARLLADGDAAVVVGRQLAFFVAPEQRDAVAAEVEGVRRTGIGVAFDEQGWLTADGRAFDAEVAAAPLEFDQSPAVLVVFRDVSERRSVERMKDQFVSTVSHELRTPLTSILGSLGLLVGGVAGELPPDARAMLEVAQRNGRRLLRLINDLLDLEKLEAGRMTFQLDRADLCELVASGIEANRGYADAHRVELELLVDPEPPAWVRVDPERLQQVLANLLSNAVRYAPRGSKVTVRVTRHPDGLEVSVRDRGPGIPEGIRGRLFERFVQAGPGDGGRSDGTGLGLAISRTIVERLNGSIGFESQPGEGTVFWVRLPELEPAVEEG